MSGRHHRRDFDLTVESNTYLTPREIDVLRMMGEGLQNKEIANKLGLHLNTVKGYSYTIFRKLHAQNRVQAYIIAKQLGYLAEGGEAEHCANCNRMRLELAQVIDKLNEIKGRVPKIDPWK